MSLQKRVAQAVTLCWPMPKQSELRGVEAITQVTQTWLYAFQKIDATEEEVVYAAECAVLELDWFPSPKHLLDFVRRFRAKRYDELKETGVWVDLLDSDGKSRIGLFPKDSPEAIAELARRDEMAKTALPDTAGMRALMNELVEKFETEQLSEKKIPAISGFVEDEAGEEESRRVIDAQMEALR